MKMITVENLSFLYRKSKRAVLHDFSLSLEKGRVYGLLGKNGAGKSTLLYLMSGLLTPKSGKVVYHDVDVRRRLPITLQDMFLVPEEFDLPPVSLISYIELNSPFYPRFSKEDMVKYLHYFEMDINIDLGALSMGQKKKVFMSFALATNTSLLLMDEPTNHLDNQGRNRLYEWVKKCRSTLIVVSHDRTLLNRLPETCELSRNALVCYGGNYEFYKQQKELQQNALQQQLDEKEKELRQIRKLAREVAERKEKQNIRSEKAVPKKGISRMAVHTLKDRAEKSTTKLADIHQNKSEKLTSERSLIRNRLAENTLLKTDFHASALHTGKTLLTAHKINFSYGNSPLWEVPLCFQLKSGDRIRIEGDNGSGKTTLLKLVTGDLLPTSGTLERAGFSYVYLNQEYSIICNQLTVLQQAVRALPEHEIKIRLNRFLFPATSWDQPCIQLSGGEKMRLAFCCLMISNNTPDLFILDEPTNNLDIQSIEIITATVRNYTGSVLLVSHDEYFVKETGIRKSIFL